MFLRRRNRDERQRRQQQPAGRDEQSAGQQQQQQQQQRRRWRFSSDALTTVVLVAVLLALGAVTIRAAAGLRTSTAAPPVTKTSRLSQHAAAQLGPASDPAATTATPTPVAPAPTDVPPATPTPTPVPPTVPITFTCAHASAAGPDNPGYYREWLCVQSAPNATGSLAVRYCDAAPGDDSVGFTTDASGAWNDLSEVVFHSTCPTPFTVTITGTGTDAAGDHLAGSTSFTVSS